MPLDAFRSDFAPRPDGPGELQARVNAAELALARRLAPGEDWREVAPGGDPAFDAGREAVREAHARLCAARDAMAGEEDPDGWPEEPWGD
jgi:hypothetical protein